MDAQLRAAGLRAILRHAALGDPGVATVRVRVGRRTARVRAVAHGADPDQVTALVPRVRDAVQDRLAETGLRHPPRLAVSVRPGRQR